MEKSKLGISLCLMGALVFLSGYLGITALVLVGGYVLLKEEDQKLKKSVAYAVVMYLAFLAASMVISLIGNVFDILNFKSWMYSVDVISAIYSFIRAVLSTLSSILDVAEKVAFGLFAACALIGKDIKIAFLDKFVEKHF
jgi:hypothetical protein